MKSFAKCNLLMLFLVFINSICVSAQEENAVAVSQGNRYISLKVKSLNKYNSRIEHQQKQLLNKLKSKEKHFAHKLKSTDSAAYARYQQQASPSYDSISKISKSDTGTTAANFSKNKNTTIDSIKGVQSFVQSKSGLSTSAPQAQGTTGELNDLKGKLNFRSYITQLITQRTSNLQNLGGSNSNVPGLKGIEKQVFYGKAKMNAFKDMEEDPTKAEDKAMEYLQGTDGFDKYMQNATQQSGSSMQSIAGGNASVEQMEGAGYQTKHLMQSSLLKKFGVNLGGVGKQISDNISQFRDKRNGITEDVKNDKNSLQQLEQTNKPSFKVNPMKCLPFWKRIQKQYNWETTRPSLDGSIPALLNISAMAGYKQSPKLTYGVGIASSFGLGQSWQNVHLSFQGVGLRTYTTWEWQYGIGIYAGYERMYKQALFTGNTQPFAADVTQSPHNSTTYSESVLVGLTKSYRINNKWDGQIQILYDIWWKEKGLSSPIVLRFASIKK